MTQDNDCEKEIIIKDFPNYSISESGVVKIIISGKILRRRFNERGFSVTNLINEKEVHDVRIDKLVAEAFLDFNPEKYTQVEHMCGIKIDDDYRRL